MQKTHGKNFHSSDSFDSNKNIEIRNFCSVDGDKERLKNITNMSTKRLNNQNGPTPKKKIKLEDTRFSDLASNKPLTDSCEAKDPDKRFIRVIKTALGYHYFDISSRFGFDCISGCVRHTDGCQANHSGKNPVKPMKVNDTFQLDVKQLITEDRPLHYLKMIEDSIVRGEFPDTNMLLLLLELMLTVSKTTSEYSERKIINECYRVMDATISAFPPCWHGLKSTYISILTSRLQSNSLQKSCENNGIFNMVIFLLEKYTETDDNVVTTKQNPNGILSVLAYKKWETHQTEEKYDFNLLKREDKLQRLFLVLKLLVKILELDLSVWMLKYPKQTKYVMEMESKRPIIASLIWSDHTSGDTNAFIRRVIGIYVNVISLDFPSRDIDGLSKLISLIGVAINLSEFQEETVKDAAGRLEIVYPCVKHNTICYASNIKKAIEQSPYYGFELYTKVFSNMRNPMIRLLLTNELFDKITPYSSNSMTMAKCAKLLRKNKAFVSKNRATLGELGALQSTSSLSCMFDKYLKLDKKRKHSRFSEISREQYMDLFLVAFKSYLEVYRIHDLYKSSKVINEELKNEQSMLPDSNEIEMGSPDFFEKIDYDALEANIEMSEQSVNMKEKINMQTPNLKSFPYVSIQTEKYEFILDEIKFYLNIVNDTSTLYNIHPTLFQELKTFVDQL